jgi:taurine dioxygenase
VSSQDITVTPCSPHVGAEIGNIDLRQPLSNKQVSDVYGALLNHGVIFFRDQDIDFEQHQRFAQYFGKLHIHVGGEGTASSTVPDYPAIRKQYFDRNSKRVSGEDWHSDQSCADIPPDGSILRQTILPPNGGGDTLFMSACAAYDALSEPMKAFLENLEAEHDGAKLFNKSTTTVYPKAVHPVITRHPETGKKLIFVNEGFTTRIVGLPKDESDAILNYLYKHIAKPHWQMRFRWLPHSIAFWDNRATQHQAIWDYWPEVRCGYRVQFVGTKRPAK